MQKDDKRQQDQSPPSELTPAKKKLEPHEDIQFGYQGTLYNLQSTAVIITSDGLGAEGAERNLSYDPCAAYGACPLKGRAEFEVKITKICRTITRFDIGVFFVSKYRKNGSRRLYGEASFSVRPTVPGKQLYTVFGTLDKGEWSTYGQIDLRNLCEGTCVGLLLSEDGVLEFTVNGESQGIAAENVYTRNRYKEVYAYVGHWDAVATEITKAGKIKLTLYRQFI